MRRFLGNTKMPTWNDFMGIRIQVNFKLDTKYIRISSAKHVYVFANS